LDERGIEYRYREYRKEPLSVAEIETLLTTLDVEPRAVLRRNEKVAKQLEVTGSEPRAELVALMAEHPTLLQRPIGVAGDRAVVGRPPEKILALLDKH
jgi:arsenate reductase